MKIIYFMLFQALILYNITKLFFILLIRLLLDLFLKCKIIVWVVYSVKKPSKIAIYLLLQLQPIYDHNSVYVKYKKTNNLKGESMSMVGVKQRLEQEYDILIDRFSTYHSKVHNKNKKYNPKIGFDQLGITAKEKLNNDGSQLYSVYFSLKMLEDIKPDLKERAWY